MTIDQIRSAMKAVPFQPFNLRTADGRVLPVPRRDFISVTPSGRFVVVFKEDDSFSFVDSMLITSIEVLAPSETGSNQNGTGAT